MQIHSVLNTAFALNEGSGKVVFTVKLKGSAKMQECATSLETLLNKYKGSPSGLVLKIEGNKIEVSNVKFNSALTIKKEIGGGMERFGCTLLDQSIYY